MGKIATAAPPRPVSAAPAVLPPLAQRKERLRGTPQQENFWIELVNGSSHVVLVARAGTGKSTSCREGIWRLQETHRGIVCSYVAFNRSIADEFQAKLPPCATATTMHSAGFAAIRAAVPGVAEEPAKFKMYDIVDGYLPRRDLKTRRIKASVVHLARLCKGYLVDGTDRATLERFSVAHGINLGFARPTIFDLVPKVLAECLRRSSVVDFSDMTWLPVMLGLDFPPCDVLFVDEAQDLDPCQHALVQRIAGAGRLCVVGDPRQAIYGFRGADTRSITTLSEQLGRHPAGVKTLPLTMTRRCPTLHVGLAKAIVPDFEALPEAPEGEVESDADPARVLRPGVIALCRTNAPLVGAAYRLIGSNVPVAIQGRDIGDGLARLIESFDCPTAGDLTAAVERYRARETDRLSQLENSEGDIETLNDQCGAIHAASQGCVLTSEVTARIRELFIDVASADQSRYVLLSSVHRAKGREAERVAILCPNLIPHSMARTPEAVEQEANLAYVAATRSKNLLSFCGPTPSIFFGV
jgi:hypothetical protein